jgi:phosphogluconate dehydratase
MHPKIAEVTQRIVERSVDSRAAYEQQMEQARRDKPERAHLSCSNLAHVFAAMGDDKGALKTLSWPNIAMVSAYNDMLSAHQPYHRYPDVIREAARAVRATAQFAGGVPAMCDGVTQGQPGMELSLFSRDVIALSTAVALSHQSFDSALMLGICDKIVPGLFIGAARFGHLPIVFVPGGPMPSGLPNPEKAKVRKRYAIGEATREELLEAESASYHAPGTCTFYGTANSNQMLMEAMGLHVPCAAFIPPNTPLRDALTREATKIAARTTALGQEYRSFRHVIDARAIVNAIVALNATGGSTNHTLHLVAMAEAAGVLINWDDFADISAVTPLMTRIYPNGSADVNHFHAAGGVAFLIRELLDAGLMHRDVTTVWGEGLDAYASEPTLDGDTIVWRTPPTHSLDLSVLRGAADPFSADGGLKLVSGNLGRAIVKTSAVPANARSVTAPAIVFRSQHELDAAFKSGALDDRDFVAVVLFQGPRANGMPELHKLTPPLGVLQDRGHKVALVTDGRMSGASGHVLAAIHVTPEALGGGPLARIRDGDVITVDGERGILQAHVAADDFAARPLWTRETTEHAMGVGRELFGFFRANAAPAERGGGPLLS